MFLKSKFLPAFFSLGLIFAFAASAFADTIRLKDGSIIKGKIVTFRDQQFVILIGDGSRQRQMAFYAEEIETIEFEGASPLSSNSLSVSNQTPVLPRPFSSPANRPNQQTLPNSDNTNGGGANPNNAAPENTAANSSAAQNGGGQPNNPTASPTPANTPTNPPASNNSQTPVQNNAPQTNAPAPDTSAPIVNNSRPKPIQLSARVLADNTANGWTNTGWVVRKGQKIRLISSGRISLGDGRYTASSGIASSADNTKLIKGKPLGALAAVIGDDNNDFIFVGTSLEFTAPRDGALFLGVNECHPEPNSKIECVGNLNDNSGSFDVTIEIDPAN